MASASSGTGAGRESAAGSKRPRPGEDGIHSWLANKVPKVKKSGNADVDARQLADRACFMTVIDACLKDPSMIATAYAAIQKSKESQVFGIDTHDKAVLFDKVTQADRLPSDWVYQFITQHTDLQMSDLVSILKQDPEGPMKIFIFLTEFPSCMRLPQTACNKMVMYNVAHDRIVAIGNRGEKFKEKGHVTADGTLDFKAHGCYKLTFLED
eukprot:5386462-Alexandrium_andersonii.AAC.1